MRGGTVVKEQILERLLKFVEPKLNLQFLFHLLVQDLLLQRFALALLNRLQLVLELRVLPRRNRRQTPPINLLFFAWHALPLVLLVDLLVQVNQAAVQKMEEARRTTSAAVLQFIAAAAGLLSYLCV